MTDLLASYRAAGPGHDEMLQSTGAAREAWAQMADLAGLRDGEQLSERALEVQALLADNGVRVGEGEDNRPWLLDPLPVLFDEVEWATVERGLQQRARLLDAIMVDLYDEATLLSDGAIPPALVLGHPGFLRAVAGITNPGPHQLFLLGTDLARDADGAWQVISDRAQVPTGMGFTMQDRRVTAEVLSGLYRHARIRRVGPFFHAIRRAVAALAPEHAGPSPRTVLLTPGANSRAAFDQAYLATMLGYPLVEGEDLVVEDGRLWMRSLDKLEPVDVVLRHVSAPMCDPLDLRGDSRLGVPGLVEVARNGGVAVANPLGTGVLDNPGLLTYLPRLARSILGEELIIPSTVTYWCGERSMCSHVISHLDRLVLRPTEPGARPIRGWRLTLAERADLAARIAGEPHRWVGQERVEASTTPSVSGAGLEPRATQLRAFAVAAGDGYQVMSGGLARIAAPGDEMVDPTTSHVAKDVWVLSSLPYSVIDPWLAEESAPAPARVPTSISPGAAQDLFEFGRHVEHAESVTRLVRAVADRWNDFSTSMDPETSPSDGVASLITLTESLQQQFGEGSLADYLLDSANPGSVSAAVRAVSRRADSVRDQLPGDVWSAISSVERALARHRGLQAAGDEAASDLGPLSGRIIEGMLAIGGMVADSMERDVGWCLLESGRRLERALRLVRLLAGTVTRERSRAVDSLVMETVLIAGESLITYRRRYQTRSSVAEVLELLLLDARNPRSLRFQLDELSATLARVPAGSRPVTTRDSLLADVADLVREADPARLAAATGEGARVELSEMLAAAAWRLDELGEEIARVHFSHAVPTPWIDASGTFAAPSGRGR